MYKVCKKMWCWGSFIAAFVLIIFLTGCAPQGTATLDSITVKALYSENVLEIPLRCRQNAYSSLLESPGCLFYTRKTFEEVIAIVENAVATTVSGELISDTLSVAPEEGVERAMIVLGQKEQKDYFLLSRVRDKWFSISILGANILFEGESPVSEGKYLLFPQHWMRDARLKDGAVPVAYEGVEYELNPNVSMQTFFDFYNDSGWFDVKIENDAFVLEASSTTLMHPYNQKYQAPYPIRFSFSSHVGMEYLKIERDVSTE